MGKLLNDLSGKKFGRVTVVKRVENKNNRVAYLCKCDCGNELIVNSGSLLRNHTRSCGCNRRSQYEEYIIKIMKEVRFLLNFYMLFIKCLCNIPQLLNLIAIFCFLYNLTQRKQRSLIGLTPVFSTFLLLQFLLFCW